LFGNENDDICKVCNGARLRPEALNVFLHQNTIPDRVIDQNRSEFINIVDVTNMSIEKAITFFADLKLSAKDREIAKVVLKEIEDRLLFMFDVGLQYLELNRRANTLSGGEAQRIRLASQLGSQLVGALYVLDEPTIGLHQRDNDRLINTLKNLRDLGNTIVVVEHDEDTIFASDYIVDIGPGAGVHLFKRGAIHVRASIARIGIDLNHSEIILAGDKRADTIFLGFTGIKHHINLRIRRDAGIDGAFNDGVMWCLIPVKPRN
jgi:excinuclease UvrABC ATPase subunit